MAFEFRDLCKKEYDVTLIAPISMKLKSGIFNTILGATLSGKTTLLRLMAGLERPTSGEIWHKETNVTNLPVQKRNVAMVYQQFINYPSMSVFENIASPLRVKKIPENEEQFKHHNKSIHRVGYSSLWAGGSLARKVRVDSIAVSVFVFRIRNKSK